MQENLENSEYSRLVRAMRGQKSENKEKVRKGTSGVGRGLEVVLDQNSYRSKITEKEIKIIQGQ